MLPAIPKNCTVIETSLSHYVPVDGIGTVEERPVFRCIPKLESNVIRLYALGNTSKVSYRPVCIAAGVDTHAIHDYNVATGWALPDERTEDEREAESIRTSISRSVRIVRELAACNPWQFFVTITLSPTLWQNRYTPDSLQDVIKAMAKRWRRKRKDGSSRCPNFKYLLKAVVAQIEKSLLTITRLGRAAGCHAIICTQRPDIDSCSGALKSNIEIRVSTHCADTATSMTILGTGDAAKLPKISGRFVAWDGTIFQSYYFPNYK